MLARDPAIRRVLLAGAAVNQIDSTALAVLEQLGRSLAERNIELVLAEVKGPVMDRLQNSALRGVGTEQAAGLHGTGPAEWSEE